ncbi:hypothetical protein JCM5350_002199 [Sporobolomyces pararoseus]
MSQQKTEVVDISGPPNYLKAQLSPNLYHGQVDSGKNARDLWLSNAQKYLERVLPLLSVAYPSDPRKRVFAKVDSEDIRKELEAVVERVNKSTLPLQLPSFATLPLIGVHNLQLNFPSPILSQKYFRIMPHLMIIHLEQVLCYLPGETSLSLNSIDRYIGRSTRNETILKIIHAVLPKWDQFSTHEQASLFRDLSNLRLWLEGPEFCYAGQDRASHLKAVVEHNMDLPISFYLD